MKIGFVWQCPYPWDVRLEKIMKVCARNGHLVHLLCRGKSGQPESETLNGITIQRLFAPKLLRSTSLSKMATFPLFANPFWIKGVMRFLRKENFDLLIVRDLPLAFTVGALGKLFRIPVVLDMAENYPAALLAYQNPLYKPFLFHKAWLPKQYEKVALKAVDHTLVVTDEQGSRLERLGIDRSTITVVGNTPEQRFLMLKNSSTSAAGIQENANRANLLFVGKLDAHRGVDLLVRVMPALREEFPSAKLTLVGDGTERETLECLASSLGLQSLVKFAGWVDFEKVWAYIADSTICLIPHLRTEHTDTTLPNKLFDYMALGKPVVASDCRPMDRIIRETGCGSTFTSGNIVNLQVVLQKLLSDVEKQSTMGHNGQQAVIKKYNWGVEEKVLLSVIQSLSTDQPAREAISPQA